MHSTEQQALAGNAIRQDNLEGLRTAKASDLITELDTLEQRWKTLAREGLLLENDQWNLSACLRMRGLACTLARIQTEAQDGALPPYIIGMVSTSRCKMALSRSYARDTSEVLPFNSVFWSDEGERLAVDEWDELSQLYEGAAQADEALTWYAAHREALDHRTRKALLNSIGANQQMLFRVQASRGGTDKVLRDFYCNLRSATTSAGYLSSQDARTTWQELEDIGRALPNLLDEAKTRVEREAAKASALCALDGWLKHWDASSNPAVSLEASVSMAKIVLEACVTAQVPMSNPNLQRIAVLVKPANSTNHPSHGKLFQGLLPEQTRQYVDKVMPLEGDQIEEQDLSDEEINKSISMVRELVRGRKVLILGGVQRQDVVDKLKAMLRHKDIRWVSFEKGDQIGKYKVDIRRSDIVIVIRKLASHELTQQGRDLTLQHRKQFVLLTGGFGANTIVHEIYLQLIQDLRAEKLDPAIQKSGFSNRTEFGSPKSSRGCKPSRKKQSSRQRS